MLDRPFSERNNIEKQAIAAFTHLADIIIFMFDPSETCGYSLKNQKNLLNQMKKLFKESSFIVVENKSDVKKTNSKNLKISCKDQNSIYQLIEQIFLNYKKK